MASGPYWLLAGDISFLPDGPLHKVAQTVKAGFSPNEQERVARVEYTVFLTLFCM